MNRQTNHKALLRAMLASNRDERQRQRQQLKEEQLEGPPASIEARGLIHPIANQNE
jgi:hypothetical protein